MEGATTAAPNVADIENTVQKAVFAAVTAAFIVLREEFQKLFEGLSHKVALVKQRLLALEEDRLASTTTYTSTSKELAEVKKEMRKCRIAANDNEPPDLIIIVFVD